MKVTYKGQSYEITEGQYAEIQRAYYAMCEAEESWEPGSHYFLVNAFNAAGIRGLSKSEARKLGAELC